MIIQVPYKEIKEMRVKSRNIAIKHFFYISTISISTVYNYHVLINSPIESNLKSILYILAILPFIIVMKDSSHIFINTFDIYLRCRKIMNSKE